MLSELLTLRTIYCHRVFLKIMDLSLQIKQSGAEIGMCQTFQNRLTDGLPVQRLVELFFLGVDFCIGSDFPALPFLRERVGSQGDQYGFYLDNGHINDTNRERLALYGDCRAWLQYQNSRLCKAYIRHNSKADIFVSGSSTLTIDAFDNAQLNIIVAGKDSAVFVYLYGNATCTVNGQGVKVTHKNKETY